jgi:hypothetical protein
MLANLKLSADFTPIQCIKIVAEICRGRLFFRVEITLIKSNSRSLLDLKKLNSGAEFFFSCQYVRRDLIKFENSKIT